MTQQLVPVCWSPVSHLITYSVRLLGSPSVRLGGLVPPGVDQLPHKQLLDQRRPRVSGVTAVGGGPVGLDHRAALQRVNLRRRRTLDWFWKELMNPKTIKQLQILTFYFLFIVIYSGHFIFIVISK